MEAVVGAERWSMHKPGVLGENYWVYVEIDLFSNRFHERCLCIDSKKICGIRYLCSNMLATNLSELRSTVANPRKWEYLQHFAALAKSLVKKATSSSTCSPPPLHPLPYSFVQAITSLEEYKLAFNPHSFTELIPRCV